MAMESGAVGSNTAKAETDASIVSDQISQSDVPSPNNATTIDPTPISTTPKTLAVATRYCAQNFVRRATGGDIPRNLLKSFESQLSRFKIWAGYLGVFTPGKGSADYRLRHDAETKDILISMLVRLAEKVQSRTDQEPVLVDHNHERLSLGAIEASSLSSASSSSSLVLDSDHDSEAGKVSHVDEDELHQPVLREIEAIISRLYRFSTIIRKPTHDNEKERVQRYINEQLGNLDLSELDTHVRWQLKRPFGLCPKLNETSPLFERLVDGALYRRKKILYHAAHQEKLEYGIEETFSAPNSQSKTKSMLPMTEKNELPIGGDSKTPRDQKAVTFIETTASIARKTPLSTFGKSVVLTGVTMSQQARRQHLDIPPIPATIGPSMSEIKCPYCSHLITEELGKVDSIQNNRWRRHVLNDLSPYVCVFENCDTVLEQYKTTEEWIHHMMWQHTTLYSCQFAGHEEYFFNTQESFEAHLELEHSQSFSSDQIDSILQKALKPAPDVFAALAAPLQQDTTTDSDEPCVSKLRFCPMCDFTLEDLDLSPTVRSNLGVARLPSHVYKEVRNHIATHLENIALLALPERDDLGEDISHSLQKGTLESSKHSEQSDLVIPTAELFDDLAAIKPAPLQENEDIEGERSGFFKNSPFESSQLYLDENYTMEDDPVLLWFWFIRCDQVNEMQHDIPSSQVSDHLNKRLGAGLEPPTNTIAQVAETDKDSPETIRPSPSTDGKKSKTLPAAFVFEDTKCSLMVEQFRRMLSVQRTSMLASLKSRARTPSGSDPPSHGIDSISTSVSTMDAQFKEDNSPANSSSRMGPIFPSPPTDARSLKFRSMLHTLSQIPLKWENPGLLDEALRVVPLERIYNDAEEESRVLQAEAESLGSGKKAAWGYQDCVIRALMKWFKADFFSWVNNPPCSMCMHPTIGVGIAAPFPDEQAREGTQVELYQCSLKGCGNYERFPRYHDPFVLLETRKGRVGEWTNCFGMICRAMGARVRWIWNSEDHVWLETHSAYRKRWVAVDVCEQAWDKPMLYTNGWNRKLAYCIGFSSNGCRDVTRRYVRNFEKWGLPRTRTPEGVLYYILDEIRRKNCQNMSKSERFMLEGLDMRESRELQYFFIQGLTAEICKDSAYTRLQSDLDGRRDPEARVTSEVAANIENA